MPAEDPESCVPSTAIGGEIHFLLERHRVEEKTGALGRRQRRVTPRMRAARVARRVQMPRRHPGAERRVSCRDTPTDERNHRKRHECSMHVRTLNRPRREGNDDTPRTSLQTKP